MVMPLRIRISTDRFVPQAEPLPEQVGTIGSLATKAPVLFRRGSLAGRATRTAGTAGSASWAVTHGGCCQRGVDAVVGPPQAGGLTRSGPKSTFVG